MFGLINPSIIQEMWQMADEENISADFTFAQTMGNRLSQEDRYHITKLNYGTLAVICDGHSGHWAADDVIKIIASFVYDEYVKAFRNIDRLDGLGKSVDKPVMRRVCKRLHALTKEGESGTTLSMVMVRPIMRNDVKHRQLRVVMAVIGDSPVSVYSSQGYVHMPMHTAKYYKPDIQKIEKTGKGYISCGYVHSKEIRLGNSTGLAITRALGDAHLDSVLFRTPSVKCLDVGTDTVIIMASDGVFGRTEPRTAKERMRSIIHQIREGLTAYEILKQLGERHDNTTIITMRFTEDV